MNIKELQQLLEQLNSDLKYLISATKADSFDDLSGVDFDSSDPNEVLAVMEYTKVMNHLVEACNTISYLQRPIKGEYVLHRNSSDRFECEAHEYTSGDIIEYLGYDRYRERACWVVSSVEHNSMDYYIVGSKSYNIEMDLDIPMGGLRVRIRK